MNEVPRADDVGTLKHTLSRRLTDPIENKEPIIKFIELNMCILDDLHMLLRVTDKLYDLFLLKCILLDKNDGVDLSLRKNLAVFLDFLEVNCKKKMLTISRVKDHNLVKFSFVVSMGTKE